ncbi:MAG TPA: HAMP domain-containing sensor histidine kinase [Solirubrobacteraceae bacterium]|nr:HAMP domain-containing sensor histidine kinase [Solirubrobacteraceae bacterium]
MTLRGRVALVAAGAVALALALAAGGFYMVVRGQLRGEVDDALRGQAILVIREGSIALVPNNDFPGLPPSAGGRAPYWQIVAAGGQVVHQYGPLALPVSHDVTAVATGQMGTSFQDATVGGVHVRIYCFHDTSVIGPVAVELARPLQQTDRVLSHLRLILVLICLGGIAVAAILGRLLARRVLAPLAEVAGTAEHITETEDLSSRIHVQHPEDEVGQLATRFNAMVERLQHSRQQLDDSARAQRQLVADASHELRTPVTSLRTNVEVLLAEEELSKEERDRLLADVVEQTEELSGLVGDLIELARGDLPLAGAEEVRLDQVVEEAMARARRDAPGIVFEAELEPVVISGVPDRLGRAVGNLLDNAARHSSPGGLVEVTVDARGVRVRDHGTGIDEPDLPYVFDRFFRGVNSRGRQGSGLGLAIVRQVTEQHGGTVSAANAPGGGAQFTLELPLQPTATQPAAAALKPEGSPALWLDGRS